MSAPDRAPDPAPIVELIDAFRRSKTMFTAVSLGLFEALAEGPADAGSLAARLGAAADPLEDRVVLGGQLLGDRRRIKADHLVGGPAEHPLRGRVPQHHCPVRAEGDDRVGRGLDDGARGGVYPLLVAPPCEPTRRRGSCCSIPPRWVRLLCHHIFMVPPRQGPGQRKPVTSFLGGEWPLL